jgi:preprotein translocase YajC subunit
MGFFIQDAMAQGAAAPAQDPWVSMLPMVIILVVIYFLIMRPQQKRQKEHKAMMAALAVGDEVSTAGGVLGKVPASRHSCSQSRDVEGCRSRCSPDARRRQERLQERLSKSA